ncbi:MAG: hypothetical protein V4734_02460, partial [Terriglobus sp.]
MPVVYEDCKTALLRDIGSIQSPTAMLGVDLVTNCIAFCSSNIAELIGTPPETLLGHTTDVLPQELRATLSNPEGRHLHWWQRDGRWQPIAAYREGPELLLEAGPAETSVPQARHW